MTWSGTVVGTLILGYDTSWRLNSQQVNGASLSFGYDADSLLTSAGAETVVRDPQTGRITGTTLGSITDTYGYDANGLLASYAAKFGNTALYSETIVSRDGAERITERTETLGGTATDWAYGYDTASRLTTVMNNGTLVSQYGYDADDNRTSVTHTGGSTVNPVYDAQDRLTAYGATTFNYGRNGELQSKTTASNVMSTTYDVLGNLVHVGLSPAANDGTSSIDYVVDGENRRVGKKINGATGLSSGYLYQDALNVVAQLDGSGNLLSRFVFGTKPNVPDYYTSASGTFRILSDHLGSPRLVVNASTGVVFEEIDYDEFGVVTKDTAPGTIPIGFAGGLYEKDTGFVRFGARDYDPSVGRWTSKDPSVFASLDSDDIILYGYALNDPINFVDLDGPKSIPNWTCPLPRESGMRCRGCHDCSCGCSSPSSGDHRRLPPRRRAFQERPPLDARETREGANEKEPGPWRRRR